MIEVHGRGGAILPFAQVTWALFNPKGEFRRAAGWREGLVLFAIDIGLVHGREQQVLTKDGILSCDPKEQWRALRSSGWRIQRVTVSVAKREKAKLRNRARRGYKRDGLACKKPR